MTRLVCLLVGIVYLFSYFDCVESKSVDFSEAWNFTVQGPDSVVLDGDELFTSIHFSVRILPWGVCGTIALTDNQQLCRAQAIFRLEATRQLFVYTLNQRWCHCFECPDFGSNLATRQLWGFVCPIAMPDLGNCTHDWRGKLYHASRCYNSD